MAEFSEGAPCWVDVMLPDLEAGKRFYWELFGWTYQEGEAEYGYYTQAFSDGKNVAGLAPAMEGQEDMPPAWSLYFASSDIYRTTERIRANGGVTLTGPMQVGEFGSMLMAKDPAGAVFGVWQPGTHKGFEKYYEPGSFGWAEVCVWETEDVDAFYPAVFPYEGVPSGEEGIDLTLWKLGGKPVAGRFKLGEDASPDVLPYVIVYFVVSDCDEAIATVQRLGGQVRTGPQDTPYGRVASVADPQGASFSVIDPMRTAGEATG
jgi:predicted enzyme related to lactoylglutathione lyase